MPDALRWRSAHHLRRIRCAYQARACPISQASVPLARFQSRGNRHFWHDSARLDDANAVSPGGLTRSDTHLRRGEMTDIVLMEGRGFGFVTFRDQLNAHKFLEVR